MRIALASGTLLLLTLTAAFKAEVPRQSRAPATGAAPSQRLPNKSEKALASNNGRKIPCKTPENASQCYWTHGRLSYYSVNFTWSLWKVGTHRRLKICDESTFVSRQGTGDCVDPEFPANLQKIYDIDRRRWKREGGQGEYVPPDVFADFEICPLDPEQAGVRQYACVESAKITFVEK